MHAACSKVVAGMVQEKEVAGNVLPTVLSQFAMVQSVRAGQRPPADDAVTALTLRNHLPHVR